LLEWRLSLTRQLAEAKAQPATTADEVKTAEQKVALAEAEVEDRPEVRRAALERLLAAARERLESVKKRRQAGEALPSNVDVLEAHLARLDVEIALARLPAK
jgi:hypothetical protein